MHRPFAESFDFRMASPDEVLKVLASRLRDQRMAQLMPQEELARRSGVCVNAIKKLESTGKVTVETLVLVAMGLGIIEDLTEVFKLRVTMSIADMERAELAARRKRARRPRG